MVEGDALNLGRVHLRPILAANAVCANLSREKESKRVAIMTRHFQATNQI